MTSPIIIAHWRIITDPVPAQDGLYHTLYSGAYAPRTACGIHRGGKTWHEEYDPPVEERCETCTENRLPDAGTPEPPSP